MLLQNVKNQENFIVSLDKVNKIFQVKNNPLHVLKDISFQIQEGEVVAMIGPSGSGKSTCLRTINALETITSGDVIVCGINYRNIKKPWHKVRRNTGMIFQRFELFPHLSAQQNVMIGITSVLGKSKEEAYLLSEQLLDKVGLKSHKEKYPQSLSGGQQQRVAIARALAVNPKILLCDEPTSALDPELVDEVTDILADIAKGGMTMIVVTHELSFAKQVSHRTLFLEGGSIVEEGSTETMFANPKTDRLKNFLKKVRHL